MLFLQICVFVHICSCFLILARHKVHIGMYDVKKDSLKCIFKLETKGNFCDITKAFDIVQTVSVS